MPPRKAGADQRYKEFKIVAFYDEAQKHRLVCGTRGDHAVAGRLMRREAARIRLDLADEKVGNVDGSPWIRNEVQRQCLPLDALGLDFYHLRENVQKARREIYGEDDEAGQQWLGDLLHVFKHEGYEAAWQSLLEWRAGLRRGKRKAADRLLNYVSERREMIRYPEFVEKGWQIGSGPTEATCKTLTARLKGSGMRWDADNAEALMALEALTQSGQWEVYWQTQLRRRGRGVDRGRPVRVYGSLSGQPGGCREDHGSGRAIEDGPAHGRLRAHGTGVGGLPRRLDMKTTVAVYDTKPYDRESFARVAGADAIDWRFLEFRLGPGTAHAALGAQAVCVFVNDEAGREVLEELAGLGVRLLALRCTGFNKVDLPAARELGLPVTRVPNYSPYSVAEHTVALILALNRKLHRAFGRVREHNFSLAGLEGFDLHGKTAGVIGTGRIGRIVAELLKGFGMRVLGYDAFPDPEWAARHGIAYTDPRTLARESDVVTLHLPLTPETRHLVRRDTLDLMKPGAMLVNVSRGQLIDTKALIRALKSRRLGGVALDVYEEEEGIFFEDLSGQVLEDDVLTRLLTFPNVLITAHQAFLTREALHDIASTTVENVKRLTAGEPFLEGTSL